MVIGSPPAVEGGAKLTPPSSPHVGGNNDTGMLIQPGAKERNDAEPIDLQLDYWTVDSNSTGSTNLSFDSGSRVSSNLSSMTSSKLRSDHSSSRTDSKRDNSRAPRLAIRPPSRRASGLCRLTD